MAVRPITKLTRSDLADLNAFAEVARLKSFRAAANQLGLSPSALSHAVKGLEGRLGVRLLNRTSRQVSLTSAGEAFFTRLNSGFEEIGCALREINRFRDKPAGRLRLNVLSDGARLLLAEKLPGFLAAYPDISVEVAVDDHLVDIVSAGFDAGIRYGGTVPEDLVSVQLSAPLRWVAVASPGYLRLHRRPDKPEDLQRHMCIQIRTGAGVIYRWEFEKNGQMCAVDVPGQLCVNDTALGIEMALAGHGIMYCVEARVTELIRAGALQIVLPEWAPLAPPFYLYFPGHRHLPPGLRELIDMFLDPR